MADEPKPLDPALAAFVADPEKVERFLAMWRERGPCDENHFAPGACYDCQVYLLLALLTDRETQLTELRRVLGEREAELAAARAEIAKLNDDWSRTWRHQLEVKLEAAEAKLREVEALEVLLQTAAILQIGQGNKQSRAAIEHAREALTPPDTTSGDTNG